MNTIKSWFVHYKTSLAGIAGAALNQYASGTSVKSVLFSLALAAIGLFSSDAPTAPAAK